MKTLLFIILLLIIGGGIYAYYYFNRFKFYTRVKHTPTINPEEQARYEQSKHQSKEEEKSLTWEERIDLSWQFLADIREIIIRKFTKEDKQKVHKAGEKLINNGMEYVHDVELGIKRDVITVRSLPKGPDKGAGISK